MLRHTAFLNLLCLQSTPRRWQLSGKSNTQNCMCVQVAEWAQDALTAQQALRALVHALLLGVLVSFEFTEGLARLLVHRPERLAVHVCRHLLTLASLSKLLGTRRAALHQLLALACAQHVLQGSGAQTLLSAQFDALRSRPLPP